MFAQPQRFQQRRRSPSRFVIERCKCEAGEVITKRNGYCFWNFRRGFEAAQNPNARGKTYDEAAAYLGDRHPQIYREAGFRHGYERGQSYYQQISASVGTAR